jgi:archaellum component FlaG (FlaF/FlaG flagellin family)
MIQKDNTATKTITEFIEKGLNNSIQFQNSSYFTIVNGEIMEDYNIYRDRYFHNIMQYTTEYTMGDDEFKKYQYQPKRLSADLYHTVDYWYILLCINKMSTRMQFKKKHINILTYGGIEYIKTLAKKEEGEIAANKISIAKQLESAS